MKIVTIYMPSFIGLAVGIPPRLPIIRQRVFRRAWLARLYALWWTTPMTVAEIEDLKQNVAPLR